MKFSYPLEIGDKTFLIEDEATTQQEMFEKVAPMQALEIAAKEKPDVYLSFRTTRDGHKYYALICPSEKSEFALGASQKRPGELFPGKVVKSGNTKKTVREWSKMQYGEAQDHDDDPEENREEPKESKKPKDQGTGQASSSNVLPIENRPLTDDQMAQIAQAIVAGNGVSKTESGYRVQVNPKTVFEVTKAADGSPACNCERFKPGVRCQHIRAVAIWTTQPAKPDSRSELKLLVTDLLDAGYEVEEIDAMIARVCDGHSAIEELNAGQLAKALRSLGQKLDERKLKVRASA